MAARKMKGTWWVDFRYEGERYRRKSPVDTKRGAEEYERRIRTQIQDGTFEVEPLPTFDEWWNGRYWKEWVIGRKNKPSTVEGKTSVYEQHLKQRFGRMRLDEIKAGPIAAFRADLVERGLGEKTINNILAVLSKPLHYAVDVELLARAPKVGLFKVEPPELVSWELKEYVRLLDAARTIDAVVYAAVCLAGEAGLRVGEVKALRWREDVDMVAKTITVNQQMRRGVVGTPKGRTRRVVPMTSTLFGAIEALSAVREGYVIRNLVGQASDDERQIKNLSYKVCRLAGLPERGWHTLRHTFGTHAALLGVNPWRLMTWMGHKRIEETLRYVHVAEAHGRDTPQAMLKVAEGIFDPDKRVLVMLGARAAIGHALGTTEAAAETTQGTTAEVGHQMGTSAPSGGSARRLQVV